MITNKFRSKRIRFLIATDVASRGLDFSSVSHVFIYHLSDDPDLYLHRSGRTGRFDKAGVVVTLVTDKEMRTLKEVLTILKAEANWIGNPPPPKEEEHSRPKRPRRPPPRPRVSH